MTRVFILIRHAESTANTAHVLSSDPARDVPLTPRGRRQARDLRHQLALLDVELAICTRFLRTRETARLALGDVRVPVEIEPQLDEPDAGSLDGLAITEYWSWRHEHRTSDRFPRGESLDDALDRYRDAFARLLDRDERIITVVCHELALRCLLEAAHRPSGRFTTEVPNAVPFLLGEVAMRRAVAILGERRLPSAL